MKVYISDPNEKSSVAIIVRNLGHELIFPVTSENGRPKGDFSSSFMDADVAIFSLSTETKIGIMDHLQAYLARIPALSVRKKEDEGNNITENIGLMSKLVHFSNREDLTTKIQDFLDEVSIGLENESLSAFKERK